MYYLKLSIVILIATTCWLVLVFTGGFNGWWMKPIAPRGDYSQFFLATSNRLSEQNLGHSALVLIEDGAVVNEFFSGSQFEIDGNTVFATSSFSKWLTAYGVLKLIQDGKAELDAPIHKYISSWQLPPGEFDQETVTIRHLLSHTAGLTDGLGFGDYTADEILPNVLETLSNPRASSNREVEIAVSLRPGTEWRYSGGGYLILELLIEEITGQSFEDYMNETVFQPIGMDRSGYDYLGDIENNAGSINQDGSNAPVYKYASKAATGFVTSSNDLSRFVLSLLSTQSIISPLEGKYIAGMREPHGRTSGFDIWGLGTILYAPTGTGDFVFGHDGANNPAINITARINSVSKDAIIVLVTGHPTLATNIGSEWVLWQTGNPDILDADAVIASMYIPAIIGVSILLLLASYLVIRHRSRQDAA